MDNNRREEIETIMADFIEEGKKEDGHKIIFNIDFFDSDYLSEGWAKGMSHVHLMMFLRNNIDKEFIITFILDNFYDFKGDLKNNIRTLLSETLMYHTMQSSKKTAVCMSKTATHLPSLKAFRKKESLASIKQYAKKKAKELLKCIPKYPLISLASDKSNPLGEILIDFINNTDSYYDNWDTSMSATSDDLRNHLKSLGITPKKITDYIAHFKIN